MSGSEAGDEPDYLCIGVCLPDDEGAYCVGCGRPWGERQAEDWDDLSMPPLGDADEAADDAQPGQAAR